LTILGVLISLPLLLKRDKRWELTALWGYAILFSFFMTAGAIKFDRYLLPVFPTL